MAQRHRQTIVDQIEITRDGTVQIRFGLLKIEDGVEDDCKWHRTVVPVGHDAAAQIAAVNAHLVIMGYPPVDKASVARVLAHIDADRKFAKA